jgi:shikimate kinase
MKSSVALIGFMGAGKSEVAAVLAQKLGKGFVELDTLVVELAGKSIPAIFEQDGEAVFRKMESQVALEVSEKKGLVIACGGGVVLNPANIDALKKEAMVIYLKATPEALLARLKNERGARPLMKTADKAPRIKELLKFRAPLYEKSADIVIDTTALDVEEVAQAVISKLKEYARTSG